MARPLRLLAVLLTALACLASTRAARAQVVDVNVRNTVFHEPSNNNSQMTVLTPAATLAVMPWDWLTVSGHYEADIVSGASEPVKAGPLSSPDIISQASVTDVRHVFGGSFTLNRKNTHLTAGYNYGAENDYRSHGFSVAAGTDFLQKNTQIELAYARGFDKVCNQAYAVTTDPTLRQPLDSSDGCFTSDPQRQAQDIDIDNFQAAWTQSWTPLFTTQVVGTFQLQHGFLGNPYRGVVIGSTGQIAQEHHPDDRARSAVALRAKYYLKDAKTTVGLGVRGYRDTWDILSQTVQLDAERYMLPWLRLLVRGRFYNQTGALFWSDDYTGGEPAFGPRGQYWSGDRELSPLKSYMVGGRVLGEWRGRPGDRILGMLLNASAGANLDVVKTQLEDFTLAGQAPDDTWAFILGLGLSGGF